MQAHSNIESNSGLVIGGIDVTKTADLVSRSYPEIKLSVEGKNVYLFFGISGHGKSTLVNHLLGCNYRKAYNNADSPVAAPCGHEYAKVGRGRDSETFSPKVFQTNCGLNICDTPGLQDTRSVEDRVAVSINTQAAIKLAGGIAGLVVVISQKALNGRARDFFDLCKALGSLLINPDINKESMLFVITQAKERTSVEHILSSLQDMLDSLNKKIHNLTNEDNEDITGILSAIKVIEMMLNNPKNIILHNVCHASADREKFFERLKLLKPIDKDKFNFDRYDENRFKFNHVIRNIVTEGMGLFRKKACLAQYINQCGTDILDTTSKIKLYKDEIESLKSSDPTKTIKLLLARKSTYNGMLADFEKDAQALKKDITAIENDLKILDTQELTIYKPYKIDEERMRWLGRFAYSVFVIRYNDIPFHSVKTTFSKGAVAITSVGMWKVGENGIYYLDMFDPNAGVYKASYHSGYGEKGFAAIEILLPKCQIPEHKTKIQVSKQQLQGETGKLMQLERLYNKIAYLRIENSTLDKSLESLKTKRHKNPKIIRHTQNEITKFRNEILLLEKKISTLSDELGQNESLLQSKRSSFDFVINLRNIVEFDDDIFRDFINLYHGFCSVKMNTQDVDTHNQMNCPLTLSPMIDAVMISCGHSFERSAVLKHFEKQNASHQATRCPECKEHVDQHDLTVNWAVVRHTTQLNQLSGEAPKTTFTVVLPAALKPPARNRFFAHQPDGRSASASDESSELPQDSIKKTV